MKLQDKLPTIVYLFFDFCYTIKVINMKKIKKILKNIIEYLKSLRISTIYKLVGVILLCGISFWIYKTLNQGPDLTSTQNKVMLNGTITNKGSNYIIIEDQSNNEYLIQNVEDQNYQIGSDVSANVNEVVEEGNKENQKPITITSNEIDITYNNTINKNADNEIIAYLTATENYMNDINYQEEIKSRFITIVDFLFYNGQIKGYTLNDLSNKAKFQVFKIALSIDTKIENYLPGYKESISATTGKAYTGLKSKVVTQYLILTTKVCNYDQELCQNATKDFQEIKKTFSITWNMISDLVGAGTNNLKKWYEIFSGKTS